MKMIGNVSDWLFYAGGALIKVADSAGSTVFFFLYLLQQPLTRITCFLSPKSETIHTDIRHYTNLYQHKLLHCISINFWPNFAVQILCITLAL